MNGSSFHGLGCWMMLLATKPTMLENPILNISRSACFLPKHHSRTAIGITGRKYWNSAFAIDTKNWSMRSGMDSPWSWNTGRSSMPVHIHAKS